jgi:hypothetical protein
MSAGCSGVVCLEFPVTFLFAVNWLVASDCVTLAAGTATLCPITITINSVKTQQFILSFHETFFMEFWFLKVVPKFLNMFLNQVTHNFRESMSWWKCYYFSGNCLRTSVFFLITVLRKLDLDLPSGSKERNVLLRSSALRQFYSKTETDSDFENPIMKKSRRCPK